MNIPAQDLFPHIRIVMAMIIGLGITRLLTGIAGLVHHPGRHKLSALHLLWVGSVLLELVIFWWWELRLTQLTDWNFRIYLLLLAYTAILYMLASLLFPDSISEYDGYEDFFIQRRRWFFSFMAAAFFLDIGDTVIKGEAHWGNVARAYVVQIPIGLAACAFGFLSPRRKVQFLAAAAIISCQLYLFGHILYAN